LHKKQGSLRRKGVLYPHNLGKLSNSAAPRHHWFEKNLKSIHLDHLKENLKNILTQVNADTHTIILSSEGIYNYWWDLPDESKNILAEIGELFDTEIWVWFREPFGFIESFYKQCIRNPQVTSNPCYGKDLSLAEMLDIDWFHQHLNYQGFINECRTMFGRTKVSVFEYEGDVVQTVIQRLGLATPHDNPTPRQNNSLNSASIAILRTINRYNLKPKDKELLIPHIRELDVALERYGRESIIDDNCRSRILDLYEPPDSF